MERIHSIMILILIHGINKEMFIKTITIPNFNVR